MRNLRASATRNLVRLAVWWLRNPAAPGLSPRILRALGAEVGTGVIVKRSLLIDNAIEDADSAGDFSHLHIGENVYLGDGVYCDLAGEILIGDDVVVAGHARFVTHQDMNRSPFVSAMVPRRCEAVIVERGAAVGFGATLLAGSVVATESLVAAGALLLQGQATEPRSAFAGVPARKIRDLQRGAAGLLDRQ